MKQRRKEIEVTNVEQRFFDTNEIHIKGLLAASWVYFRLILANCHI